MLAVALEATLEVWKERRGGGGGGRGRLRLYTVLCFLIIT